MTTLMNVRIPEDLKDDFHDVCKRNNTYMTTEIIRFMKEFITQKIDQELSHQNKLMSLDRPTSLERNLNSWGHLVQNPITEIWMSKREYYSDVK